MCALQPYRKVIMRKALLVLFLPLIGVLALEAVVGANEAKSASEIMKDVWGHFTTPEMKTEIERSKMTSTNWTTPEKFCNRWVKALYINNSSVLYWLTSLIP